MKPYARLLHSVLDGRSVVTLATAWGVPRWVIDDGLSGKVTAPSAKYLPAVARGLRMTVGELLEKIAPEPVPG